MIRNDSNIRSYYGRYHTKMMSRRIVSVLTFACVSLVLLLFTSRRLGSWSSLENPYYHAGGRYSPQDTADRNSTRIPSDGTHRSGYLTSNDDLPPRPGADPLCDTFPDTTGILLVMKTGATESYDKVPTQLMTVLKCLPDFLIFSDLDQRIAGYRVHDSLDTVLAEAKDGNGDFDLYRRQRQCPVDQDNCNKLGDAASEGWNLDKYKNIHIAEKAYAMRPGYDWYVFVDADTYVLWPNLVRWLRQLKPAKKHYLGSVSLINEFPFGHGGSGYILSRATMAEFVGKNPGIANKYDVQAKNECCGDFLFAMAMKETSDVAVQQTWPTINGEKPSTLPFGPTHWCQPLVTMHHMNSEEISSFWEFERRRYSAQNLPSVPPPLLLKDIYAEFLAPRLLPMREDWDNGADERYYLDTNDTSRMWEEWQAGRAKKPEEMNEAEKVAHKGFAECRAACESVGTDECFQFRWHDGVCGFSKAFSLGVPKKREDRQEKRFMSGWDVAKIEKWIADQGDCGKTHWPEA